MGPGKSSASSFPFLTGLSAPGPAALVTRTPHAPWPPLEPSHLGPLARPRDRQRTPGSEGDAIGVPLLLSRADAGRASMRGESTRDTDLRQTNRVRIDTTNDAAHARGDGNEDRASLRDQVSPRAGQSNPQRPPRHDSLPGATTSSSSAAVDTTRRLSDVAPIVKAPKPPGDPGLISQAQISSPRTTDRDTLYALASAGETSRKTSPCVKPRIRGGFIAFTVHRGSNSGASWDVLRDVLDICLQIAWF